MNKKTIKILSVVITLAVIAYGAWILFGLIQNKKFPVVQESNDYTPSDILAFKQHCKQTLQIRDRYPEITSAYCDCYVEAVTRKYSKRELEELGSMSSRERDSIMNDIIVSCAKATGRDTVR